MMTASNEFVSFPVWPLGRGGEVFDSLHENPRITFPCSALFLNVRVVGTTLTFRGASVDHEVPYQKQQNYI